MVLRLVAVTLVKEHDILKSSLGYDICIINIITGIYIPLSCH